MPNADIIARTASAVWLEDFYQMNVWPALAADMSSEIPGYGDRIEMPSDDTAYAMNALHSITTANLIGTNVANHQWSTPIAVTGNKVDLVLDKAYDISVLIGTVLQRRVRPSYMESAVKHSARVFREKFNADVRGALDAAAGPQQLTAITTTAANYGAAAHITAIGNTLRTAKETADYAHWPRGSNRVCVASPSYHDLIGERIIDRNIRLQGTANDMALIFGEVLYYQGWTIVMDDSLDEGKAAGDGDHHTLYFVNRGEGFGFAQEIRGLRIVDSEVYRGQLLQGIMTHGAVINRPSKIRICKTNIT